ncbi:hypothetical protein TNCV_4937521 [Trichonephila clavipes]|nr:hypothetical protein TNCV_4937521 [Trichonephila clavipes]
MGSVSQLWGAVTLRRETSWQSQKIYAEKKSIIFRENDSSTKKESKENIICSNGISGASEAKAVEKGCKVVVKRAAQAH